MVNARVLTLPIAPAWGRRASAAIGEMKKKYLSTDYEPALGHRDGASRPPPAEPELGLEPSELEALRDSVANEPALPDRRNPQLWTRWIEQRRRQTTLAGNLLVTLLAATLGGPFAVLGALIAGQPGLAGPLYAVLFAPVVEEILKQSGMTYVLERMPYRVFSAWQFVFAGAVSGLAFGAIENVAYAAVYSASLSPESLARLTAFRWPVCTALHVGCSTIASLGLVRAWKRQLQTGRPAELAAAMPQLLAAMLIHGAYNLWAVLLGPSF